MSVRAISPDIYFGSRRDKVAGFSASVLFHVLLLTVGGVFLIKPVEYGIENGIGGVEVHLVAAPAEPVVEEAPVVTEEPVKEEIVEKIEEIIPVKVEEVVPDQLVADKEIIEEFVPPKIEKVVPKAVKMERVQGPVQKPPVLMAKNVPEKGDGRSSVPGKSETTLHSTGGGALTEAKPNYLKNPAPPYPWEAKKKGWEGVVLLKVFVDKAGKAVSVDLEKSSGHSILDESALKTIKKWKFRPALLGDMPVESSVRVPVKFLLEDS